MDLVSPTAPPAMLQPGGSQRNAEHPILHHNLHSLQSTRPSAPCQTNPLTIGLLPSQGSLCVHFPCIHFPGEPFPATCLFCKPQVKHPLLWGNPPRHIPLNLSLPTHQRPVSPATALTPLNSCAFPLCTGHWGLTSAWHTGSTVSNVSGCVGGTKK